MLIDNKVDRYPNDGIDIVTVWDFLKTYSSKDTGETGKMDIVTGYFTIFSLSKLYEELPEENYYRIISSEMVGDDYKKDVIVNLLSDDMDISNIGNLDKHARQAIALRSPVQKRPAKRGLQNHCDEGPLRGSHHPAPHPQVMAPLQLRHHNSHKSFTLL